MFFTKSVTLMLYDVIKCHIMSLRHWKYILYTKSDYQNTSKVLKLHF
jgi:hypothetical protein